MVAWNQTPPGRGNIPGTSHKCFTLHPHHTHSSTYILIQLAKLCMCLEKAPANHLQGLVSFVSVRLQRKCGQHWGSQRTQGRGCGIMNSQTGKDLPSQHHSLHGNLTTFDVVTVTPLLTLIHCQQQRLCEYSVLCVCCVRCEYTLNVTLSE